MADLEKGDTMKKNILILIGGFVAGVAACLTAARLLPFDSFSDDELF